jgi:ribonuclease HI
LHLPVAQNNSIMFGRDSRLDSLPHVPRKELSRLVGKTGPPIQNAASKRRFVTQFGSHPLDIFTPAVHCGTLPAARWIYTDNEAKPSVFIFTDGASPGNGQPGARAGCGIVYSLLQPGMSFPLERAPDGSEPTSNRAESRAVIGALTMRFWPGEGFFKLVIGTDSEYVVKGVTEWCQKWKANGWKTASGTSVKNQDLWELLLEKIEGFEGDGFSVQFFQLKREWNEAADRCAKQGAVCRIILLL